MRSFTNFMDKFFLVCSIDKSDHSMYTCLFSTLDKARGFLREELDMYIYSSDGDYTVQGDTAYNEEWHFEIREIFLDEFA